MVLRLLIGPVAKVSPERARWVQRGQGAMHNRPPPLVFQTSRFGQARPPTADLTLMENLRRKGKAKVWTHRSKKKILITKKKKELICNYRLILKETWERGARATKSLVPPFSSGSHFFIRCIWLLHLLWPIIPNKSEMKSEHLYQLSDDRNKIRPDTPTYLSNIH